MLGPTALEQDEGAEREAEHHQRAHCLDRVEDREQASESTSAKPPVGGLAAAEERR